MKPKTYLAIDSKSFYASVECLERGLNPLTTNLVVADISRTEKTICLAVTPSLKKYGIPGRPRLFEVSQKVREINAERRRQAPGHQLSGASSNAEELKEHPEFALDYLVARPRMALYMEYSTRIYQIYLKYIAPEDIHVYSVDEVFMDVTEYLDTYGLTAEKLAAKIVKEVLETVGITATVGIGTNLYLCKVAMDIQAKHILPDENGMRIAVLDERSYRKLLWGHRPITDFWRVGRGYAKKLEQAGLYTMGDIARCSIGKETDYHNEELLYKLFGVNAELLIDHAWGWEPCTMADIKSYKPTSNSIGSGQVLACPYETKKARLVVQEMTENLVLNLVEKGLVTDQMVLSVGYDIENLSNAEIRNGYHGEITTDRYGRKIPKQAHGTKNLKAYSSSTRQIEQAVMELFDQIVNPRLLVRRINLTANRVIEETAVPKKTEYVQMNLFTDYAAKEAEEKKESQELEREKKLQKAMLEIKNKYGKNAILKGMNLLDGATAKDRNEQIGGHKA